MTFQDVMQLTRTVSSHAAFEDEECEEYFNVLMTLPKDALIVEIGLEYGRSSSIALQIAKAQQLGYLGIDPFDGHPEVRQAWINLAHRIGYQKTTLITGHSSDVKWSEPIYCILIDGDHSYEGVLDDLNHFLRHVVKGGYACLHDCDRESLPDVIRAAKEYFGTDDQPNPNWEKYQQAGTLGIWQRK